MRKALSSTIVATLAALSLGTATTSQAASRSTVAPTPIRHAGTCKATPRHCATQPRNPLVSSLGDLSSIVPPGVDIASGYVEDVTFAPQATSAATFTVRSGMYAMPLVFTCAFHSDVAVSNRQVAFVAIGDLSIGVGGTMLNIPANYMQPASQTITYTFAVDAPTTSVASSFFQATQIPRLLWAPKTQIKFSAVGVQANDAIQGNCFLRVAYFPWGAPLPRQTAVVTPVALP